MYSSSLDGTGNESWVTVECFASVWGPFNRAAHISRLHTGKREVQKTPVQEDSNLSGNTQEQYTMVSPKTATVTLKFNSCLYFHSVSLARWDRNDSEWSWSYATIKGALHQKIIFPAASGFCNRKKKKVFLITDGF